VACLDTTVLIDLIRPRRRQRSRARAKVEKLAHRGEMIYATRINVAELYVGVERAKDRQREEHAVQTVLKRCEILEFDDRAARLLGGITAHLQRLGKPAGDLDVLIAAICVASSELLVTANAAHFANIPNLVVESY